MRTTLRRTLLLGHFSSILKNLLCLLKEFISNTGDLKFDVQSLGSFTMSIAPQRCKPQRGSNF